MHIKNDLLSKLKKKGTYNYLIQHTVRENNAMSSHPSPGLGQQPLKSALKTDDEAAERSPAVKG